MRAFCFKASQAVFDFVLSCGSSLRGKQLGNSVSIGSKRQESLRRADQVLLIGVGLM